MSRECLVATALLLISVLTGCSPDDPVFHADERPLRLSEWKLFTLTDSALTPNPASLRIAPANSLFSDYAHKLRTLWIPPGSSIQWNDKELEYPVGTILSKTFYYPRAGNNKLQLSLDTSNLESLSLIENRLLETRLLVRKTTGWDAFPYVWNDTQTEAFLRVAGSRIPVTLQSDNTELSFNYFVPNENQCSGCHQTEHPDGGMHPLGAIASQLNHAMPFRNTTEMNQLEKIKMNGWLDSLPELQALPVWTDATQTIDLRARAYLDINCGHCHNPKGPADTSALLLDGFNRSLHDMGQCKPPVAAGGGSGNRRFGIVPGQADQSILLFRMQSDNPGSMMPELGRSLVHREGVDLVRTWINQLSGGCGQAATDGIPAQ